MVAHQSDAGPFEIKYDGNGNIIVTGSINGGAATDYLTVKYNSSGIQQWIRTYNGPGNLSKPVILNCLF